MRSRILFVTGTDTGVGKTVLAALLTSHLRRSGMRVATLKPISSGSREDARRLREALGGTMGLEEINPWHFRAPLAPLLAARRERRRVSEVEILTYIRSWQSHCDVLIVEGAGGLLSPLGEGFNSRELILALRALPLIVAPNRLGAVNQVLLTLAALPQRFARQAEVVLGEPARPGAVTRSNATLLGELLAGRAIHRLPWLGKDFHLERAANRPGIAPALARLIRSMS